MEATKWLKPSISVSRIGDSASVQGNYGDSALNASSSGIGVRREKAALSSGCKAHPATAPAGSNRSRHGGDEMSEAPG